MKKPPIPDNGQERTVVTGTAECVREEDTMQLRREREFRSLVENSPDPIYRYDRDGRRLYVNAMVSKLSGKPVAALIGKSFNDDSILVSDQRRKLMDAISFRL